MHVGRRAESTTVASLCISLVVGNLEKRRGLPKVGSRDVAVVHGPESGDNQNRILTVRHFP